MKKPLLAALSTFAISAHAWEPTYYVGSSLASWQYKQTEPAVDHNFNVTSAEGLAGIKLSPYTSLEVRAGAGLNTAREAEFEVEMNYFGSLYFKPHLSNENASLYGLIGMTTVSIDGNSGAEDETSAVSYGVGVSFVMSPHCELTAEWKKLINADAFDMRGGSVGFIYKF